MQNTLEFKKTTTIHTETRGNRCAQEDERDVDDASSRSAHTNKQTPTHLRVGHDRGAPAFGGARRSQVVWVNGDGNLHQFAALQARFEPVLHQLLRGSFLSFGYSKPIEFHAKIRGKRALRNEEAAQNTSMLLLLVEQSTPHVEGDTLFFGLFILFLPRSRFLC